MKKIKNFMAEIARIWHLPYVKYGAIIIVGSVLVGVVGENSLLAHWHNTQYIDELSEEIDEYNMRAKEDMRKIRELNRNPKAVERIAREHFFMKQDDEDIFVLSDDERVPENVFKTDETAE